MARALIKSAHDWQVLNPFRNRPIPPEGEEVELNSYWIRRRRDGDITIEPVKPKAGKAKNTKETRKN